VRFLVGDEGDGEGSLNSGSFSSVGEVEVAFSVLFLMTSMRRWLSPGGGSETVYLSLFFFRFSSCGPGCLVSR